MVNLEIGRKRLAVQGICGDHFSDPLEAVQSLGAVQAQDYPAAIWAIGLRTKNSTMMRIEKELVDYRTIVRTPLLRNTIHVVPSENLRWMIKLFSERMKKNLQNIARSSHIALDRSMIEKGQTIIRTVLQDGNHMTRKDLGDTLRERGIPVKGMALLLMVQYAHADGLICYGPRKGTQQYLVLTGEWLPPFPEIGPEDAMKRMAIQYFKGHGPASLHDFAWWTGLKLSDARLGLSMAQGELAHFVIDKTTYWMAARAEPDCGNRTGPWLLPNYDEYTVGYRDREAIIRPDFRYRGDSRGIVLSNVIVLDGEIIGTWKRFFEKSSLQVKTRTFLDLNRVDQNLLAEEVDRYISFMTDH
jgi:hypothetical protein